MARFSFALSVRSVIFITISGFMVSGCGATPSVSGGATHAAAGWSPVKVAKRDLMPVQEGDCLAVLPAAECKHAKQQSIKQMREVALDNLSDNLLNTKRRSNRIKQSRVRLKRDRVEWQYKF